MLSGEEADRQAEAPRTRSSYLLRDMWPLVLIGDGLVSSTFECYHHLLPPSIVAPGRYHIAPHESSGSITRTIIKTYAPSKC